MLVRAKSCCTGLKKSLSENYDKLSRSQLARATGALMAGAGGALTGYGGAAILAPKITSVALFLDIATYGVTGVFFLVATGLAWKGMDFTITTAADISDRQTHLAERFDKIEKRMKDDRRNQRIEHNTMLRASEQLHLENSGIAKQIAALEQRIEFYRSCNFDLGNLGHEAQEQLARLKREFTKHATAEQTFQIRLRHALTKAEHDVEREEKDEMKAHTDHIMEELGISPAHHRDMTAEQRRLFQRIESTPATYAETARIHALRGDESKRPTHTRAKSMLPAGLLAEPVDMQSSAGASAIGMFGSERLAASPTHGGYVPLRGDTVALTATPLSPTSPTHQG